jgi:2Fe-2S ferredoxin
MKIIARDRKGAEHIIEGNEGWTVMEALRDAGLPITAECGGACACATCHVYVEDGWFEKLNPPSPEELDSWTWRSRFEPNSRLSCQIQVNAKTDGIRSPWRQDNYRLQ